MFPVAKDKPEFGLLDGMKVVTVGFSTALCVGAEKLADWGADVIWAENTLAADMMRFTKSYCVDAERHNMRGIQLNVASDEGKSIFKELIEGADVFLEASKAGQWNKWGLDDEVLWDINPALIIVHMSGFGQTGDPATIKRPSYDPIGQAYSGYMWQNRTADHAFPVGPFVADYFCACEVAFDAVAGWQKARVTGKGESFDVAQYEVLLKNMQWSSEAFTDGVEKPSAGLPNEYALNLVLETKGGGLIQVAVGGAGCWKRVIEFLGLPYGSEDFPENQGIYFYNTPGGKQLREKMAEYLKTVTADEAMEQFVKMGVTAQKLNTLGDLMKDPHFIARDPLTTVTNLKGVEVKFAGPKIPRLTNYPGQVWKVAPTTGMDNESVLGAMGYGDEQIAELYDKGVINKDRTGMSIYPNELPLA